ncbi:hypothetical protein [Dokdonia pacifica]|uniref:Lipoprotein n=1 Tax=Dokdonia pacifica TaxID=1627892 RepID=A0A239B7Q6_9FLAO|nr:hypothetical protein [Dokdonia pacifica]SNS03183.1 hypothetical protein SAMN06265376_105362 [Dokdonia pacifica]
MKKIFIVMLAVVSFSSCTQDDTNIKDEQNLTLDTSFNRSNSANPLEYIGELHNLALANAIETRDDTYEGMVMYLSDVMGEDSASFGQLEPLGIDINSIAGDGYNYYTHIWVEGYIEDREKAYLGDLELVLSSGTSNDEFIANTEEIVGRVLSDEQLSVDSRNTLLGAISLAKHSYLFWDHHEQGGRASRAKGKFWADVGGFIGGFTGSLAYNNNNGNGFDVNPFGAGVAVGGFASKLAEKEKD